ncbi:MAG: ATP-dependent protease ATPase subunit HslU, partial [Betaproteobacteria bacterium]
APFIKVEATKFTEVGYVGKDVDSIVRDLVETAIKQTREQETGKVRHRAEDLAEERVLDTLLPGAREIVSQPDQKDADNATRQKFRKRLREGELDDKEIEIEVAASQAQMEIFAPPGMEELTSQIQGMFQNLGSARRKTRKLKIREAMKLLTEEEAAKLVNDEDLKLKALANVEQNGIVFIDEIDKITSRQETGGAEVSRHGVQRDLLPLIEGTTVSTKYGMIKTDHILFIGSGAFHLSKPSDLIPELQGRFPIRVELGSLSVADFERILTATDACLTRQYQALLETEEVKLDFRADGIRRMAEIAWQVNEKTENIGARRLYTVIEKLLEEVSFDANRQQDKVVVIDAAYVDDRLKSLAQSEDLARYVL